MCPTIWDWVKGWAGPSGPLVYATELHTFFILLYALITAISVCWMLYCDVFVNMLTETIVIKPYLVREI